MGNSEPTNGSNIGFQETLATFRDLARRKGFRVREPNTLPNGQQTFAASQKIVKMGSKQTFTTRVCAQLQNLMQVRKGAKAGVYLIFLRYSHPLA